jgi:hypothetical protein
MLGYKLFHFAFVLSQSGALLCCDLIDEKSVSMEAFRYTDTTLVPLATHDYSHNMEFRHLNQ